MSKKIKLAYFVWKFPSQANTYIVAEVIELIKYIDEIIIYSLDNCSNKTLEIYKEQLKDVNVKIIYISKECPLNWPRGINKKVAVHFNRRRRQIERSHDFNRKIDMEQESYEQSKPLVNNIAKHMVDNQISHIYSPFGNMTADFALFISRITKIKFSFSVHAYDLFESFFYTKLKQENASKIFAISEYNKKYLIEKCNIPENLISLKRINYIEYSCSEIEEKILCHDYIFSAGRLEEMKGFEYALEGFAYCLQQGYTSLKYYIAGRSFETNHYIEIQKKINDLQLQDNVILLGHINSKEIYSYAKGAVFSILTSIKLKSGDTEGIPTFFVESMRMGTPCIGTNVSGVPEIIIPGKTGELVEQKNQNDINEKMLDMIEKYTNKSVAYDKMKYGSRQHIKKLYDNTLNIKILANEILKSVGN